MYCSECGQEVPEKAKYCPACGSPIRELASAPEANITPAGPSYAGFWQRFWARLLDGLVVGVLAAVVLAATWAVARVAWEPNLRWTVFCLGIASAYALSFYYYWVGAAEGATVGMDVLGISIVRDKDGEPPGWGIGLGRVLAEGLLDGLLVLTVVGWVLMYLWMIWDEKHQTWYDKAVGTIVVQRQYAGIARAVLPPLTEPAEQTPYESPDTSAAATQPPGRVCPNCAYHDDKGRTSCPRCGMPLVSP